MACNLKTGYEIMVTDSIDNCSFISYGIFDAGDHFVAGKNAAIKEIAKVPFPVDMSRRILTKRALIKCFSFTILRAASIDFPINLEKHSIILAKDDYIIALESEDRIYLSFRSECSIKVNMPFIEVEFPEAEAIDMSIKCRNARAYEVSGCIEDIFDGVSKICSSGPERSVYFSHPLFREMPPEIRVVDSSDKIIKDYNDDPGPGDINIILPPDLRYLYAAAPLAYYAGASIQTGKVPYIVVKGHDPIDLPCFPGFEFFINGFFRYIFMMDCMARREFSENITDSPPAVSKGINERLVDHLMRYKKNVELRTESWHFSSYLKPHPLNAEALPFLLSSLSGIHMPVSSTITENEAYLRVAKRITQNSTIKNNERVGETEYDRPHTIVLPELKNSNKHLWFADGLPLDATKSNIRAFHNKKKYQVPAKIKPSIAIICNNKSMQAEAFEALNSLRTTGAKVEIFMGLNKAGLMQIFKAGYDMAHYIGHSTEAGFECVDGCLKAKDIEYNNTQFFFLNSCVNHEDAISLINSGSVCGIATLFKVTEETAREISKNLYVMLRGGYSISTSFEAAKECSLLGCDYFLAGDGEGSLFYSYHHIKPFFKIKKENDGFLLTCIIDSANKGYLIKGSFNGGLEQATDIGFIEKGLSYENILKAARGLNGYCLYDGEIYTSIEKTFKRIFLERAE